MKRRNTDLSWAIVALLCLTLGLAPFRPPHIVEKLGMLFRGELVRFADWMDLVLHGMPWVLLAMKVTLSLRRGETGKEVQP